MSSPAQRAGSLIAEQLPDRPLPRGAGGRQAIVERAVAGRRPRPRWRPAVALAVAAALVVAVVILWPAPARPLAFVVGEERVPGVVGAQVAPVRDEGLAIRFSEGSTVQLAADARARVAEVNDHGAAIVLESGEAHVDIVSRPESSWRVLAGPYSVLVHGTSFDVEYVTAQERLRVRMRHGRVHVQGPGLGPGVVLVDQQQLDHCAGCDEPKEAPPATASAVRPPTTEARAAKRPPAVVEPASTTPHVAPSVGAPSETDSSPPLWRRLLASGERAEALASAQDVGLDSVLAEATVDEQMDLADAARFSGRTVAARRILLSLRSRFGGTPQAASAAFVLGRMAESSAPREALTWYETYGREAPSGPLAPEAMGRRLVVLERLGEGAAARAAASSYLRNHPDGPYVGLARKVAKH